MDFSSLLGKEIQKKRANGGSDRKGGKKKKKSKDKEIIPESIVRDDDENTSIIAKPSSKEEPSRHNSQDTTVEYTPEEETLAKTLSIEDINSKLKKFGELDNEPNISNVMKIRKLGILLRKERKDAEYKAQLEKEDAVAMDINVEDMGQEQFKDKIYTQLRRYIKYLIKCWECQADTEEQKKLLLETKRDLVKLLYRLRKQSLTANMFTSLTTVIHYLQIGDFRKANETYLKLSIGNAAWPIGVRSVGIHERAADSKITGDNKKEAANIMIDDKTRRWITAIKRLISFCERANSKSS
ncbi:pre-mRNA-splicing factor 18 [[Candida] anglica]|uniref:Pre-mRNA-splicing factor 18 n=1 Tax=[Candida] anglica TaxID=148631 RepID=A0ABP0EDJ5_9ASCO